MSLENGTPTAWDQWLSTWGTPAPVEPPPEMALPPPPQQIAAVAAPVGELPQPVIAPPDQIEMPPEYVGAAPDVQVPAPYATDLPVPGVASFVNDASNIPVPAGEELDADYFNPLAPQTWDAPLGTPDLVGLAHRDPAAYQEYVGSHNEMLANEQRAEAAKIAKENALKQEEEHRVVLAAQAKAAAIQKRVLETRLDPDHFRNSRTLPQSVAGFLSIVIGGLYQSRKGGPNIGLEMLNKAADDDYQAQKDNLDKDRNMVADLRAQGLSESSAMAAHRVAWLAHAHGELATKLQDFDPKGSSAINGSQQLLQMEAGMAAAAETARQRAQKEEYEAQKHRIDALKLAADLREADDKHNAAVGKLGGFGSGGGGGGGGGKAADKLAYTPEDLKLQYPGQEVPPPRLEGWTTKQYDQWLGTRNKGEELNAKNRTNEEFASEQDRQLAVRGADGKFLFGDDQKPARMKDPEEAKKVTQSIADTDEVVRMMDAVLRLRKLHGWTSDLAASPEWRKQKTMWAELKLAKKDLATLGAVSGSDLDLLNDALGAADPTSVRDPSAGIETSRNNAVSKLQTNLSVRGVGQKYLPQYPETWKKLAPLKTSIDEAISASIKAEAFVDEPIASGSPGVQGEMKRMAADSQKARERIKYLEDAARGDGPEAAKARQGIVEISNQAVAPKMKQWATESLRSLAMSDAASKEATK